MLKIFLNENEFELLKSCLYKNINRIEYSIENDINCDSSLTQLKDRLVNLLSFIDNKSINIPGHSVLVDSDSLLDIVDSIFNRVEELNSLIISNRTMQYPTDQYEASKYDCMDLYKKLMEARLNGFQETFLKEYSVDKIYK